MRSLSVLCAVVAIGAVAAIGAATAAPEVASAGPVFSGSGRTSLRPFKVEAASTLRWTNDGPIFQIFPRNVSGGGSVNAAARAGATYLKPGTYMLNVRAVGNWTIRIVSGAERPRSLGGGMVGFRGNGRRDLPPIENRLGTKLLWTNSGSIFQIFSGDFSVAVNSRGERGSTSMAAGRHQLTVNAIGSWTVRWKP